MNTLTGWLAGLRVTRNDDFVAEGLNHDLVFVAFLISVADRVGREGASSDQALFFAGDGHVRGCCHECAPC
ncbi:hypothetical protein D3C72_1931520 [compost metagenome]